MRNWAWRPLPTIPFRDGLVSSQLAIPGKKKKRKKERKELCIVLVVGAELREKGAWGAFGGGISIL